MKSMIAVVASLLTAASGVGAQGTAGDAGAGAPSAPQAPAPTGSARFFDPEDGQFDLSGFLATPRSFLPVPLVVTEPAVGIGGGLLATFIQPRKNVGEEGFARPDITAIGAIGTENGTKAVIAGDARRWLDGRLRTLIGAGKGQVNIDVYGLGPSASSSDEAVRYSLQFSGAVAQASWQLAPRSPWALGLRYAYARVEPQLRDDPIYPDLADRIEVTISAPTLLLEYDTRDSIFTPTRGAYSETSWMASRTGLGASVSFDRFQQVLMGWHPLAPSVTLGARANYAWASESTPFFLRPFVQMRGVPAMRYLGDQMASLEAEARWQFAGRWSVVGFGGAGETRSDRGTVTATDNVTSGGVGLRYELARRFGMHVGIDVARSAGTTAWYLQVGSAWIRP